MCVRPTSVPRTEVYIQTVFLGDKEWGNEKMIGVANSMFNVYRDTPYLVVEVHEHGGWWLQYARINGVTTVVGSANDMACYPDHVKNYHAEIRGMRTTMLPTIRR